MISPTARKTSLIDVPKKHSAIDQLEIGKYEEALVKLITGADTPLTIALQGEWGSGKTSLMNTLRHRLTDSTDESCFFPIWVNTWEYSIIGEPEDAVARILRSIILQIADITPEKNKSLAEKTLGYIQKARNVLVVASKVVVDATVNHATGTKGFTGDVGKALGHEEDDNWLPQSEISKARSAIEEMLDECMKVTKNKGFLFFIDDLDRINPPVAVQILELLKNIFDLKNCIFVLAIDYQVVIKGLKPKFGDLTIDNEREFRSFFDKIIQLPFSMPVATYQIDKFLINSLLQIGFIDEEESKSEENKQVLSMFARASIGTNPRSLKRLVNILSLLRLIGNDERQKEPFQRHVDFALVCIQISYPAIYNVLAAHPNFLEWNEILQRKLDLQPLSDELKVQFKNQQEFDDPWEQTLYLLCQREPFLKTRAFEISGILNGIRELLNAKPLEEVMKKALLISSVTHVSSQDIISTPNFNQSWEHKRLNEKLLPAMNELLIPAGFTEAKLTNDRVRSCLYYTDSGPMPQYWWNVKLAQEDNEYKVLLQTSQWLLEGETLTDYIYDELAKREVPRDQFDCALKAFQTLADEFAEFRPKHEGSIFYGINVNPCFPLWSNYTFYLNSLNDDVVKRFIEAFATTICKVLKAKRNILQLLKHQP